MELYPLRFLLLPSFGGGVPTPVDDSGPRFVELGEAVEKEVGQAREPTPPLMFFFVKARVSVNCAQSRAADLHSLCVPLSVRALLLVWKHEDEAVQDRVGR